MMQDLRQRHNPDIRLSGLARSLAATGVVLILFALVFLAAALHRDLSETLVSETVTVKQVVGPITLTEPNTILTISLTHRTPKSRWAYLEATLSDAQNRSIVSFGDEFYDESERVGHNTSRVKETTDLRVLVREPGAYFLRFWGEEAPSGSLASLAQSTAAKVDVRVDRHNGDSSYFHPAGWSLLAVGLLLALSNHRHFTKRSVGRGLANPAVLIVAALSLAGFFGMNLVRGPSASHALGLPLILGGTASSFDPEPSAKESSLAGPGQLGGGPMEGK